MATVQFGYSAWSNISFRGELDSGVEREDWDEMSGKEQAEVYNDLLSGLVDLYEIEG